MMRSLKRVGLSVGAFSLLVLAGQVGGAPAAGAQVCAIVTVHTPSSDPSVGGCEPLLEEWIDPCYSVTPMVAGYGAGARVCAPSPI